MRLLVSRLGPCEEYNAIISPQDGSEGCYWTLIGTGPDDEQSRISEYIVRAINHYATCGPKQPRAIAAAIQAGGTE